MGSRTRRIPGRGIAVGLLCLATAACSADGGPGAGDLTAPAASTAASPALGEATGTATGSTTRTATRSTAPAAASSARLGRNGSLGGRRPFPATNPWNTRVDSAPVDPNSAKLITSIGRTGRLHPDFGADWNGGPFGIPYVVVSGRQKKVPVSFDYADESDRGPYPIPAKAPVEPGSDRHVLVLDRDSWTLYELWNARRVDGGARWRAGSGAVFDLSANRLRPAGWTSADAAGLPILPGLVRYDEVAAGEIRHALRFTVSETRRAYVTPARHAASDATDPNLPPMGMRVRLKASYDISSYPRSARVVLTALKRYGMIVADNGSDWYLSGTADARWNDDAMNTLKRVPGSAFEVVRMGRVTTG